MARTTKSHPRATVSDRGRVKITYQRAPAKSTREALGAAGFRWSTRDQSWYADATEAAVAFAKRVNPNFRGRVTA